MAKYYYNGVLLPEIPSDVLAEYPYLFIYYRDASATYRLYACSSIAYWYPTETYPTCMKADSKCVYYEFSDDTWVLGNESESLYGIIPSITWSNYDIPNGSATATEIYAYGSKAIVENSKFYYNGSLLPEIPCFFKYPYSVILRWSNSYAQVILSKNGFYYKNGCIWDKSNVELKEYYLTDESIWVEDTAQSNITTSWFCEENDVSIIQWSSHEIPSGSKDSAEIYFRGSDPVCEMPEYKEKYAVKSEWLVSVADEVRRLTGTEDKLTPEQIESGLKSVEVGGFGHPYLITRLGERSSSSVETALL